MNKMFRRLKADLASPTSPAITTGRSTQADAERHICYACRGSITAATKHILIPPTRSIGSERRYHTDCFMCFTCNSPIDPKSETLCFSRDRKKERNDHKHEQHPFHKSCYDDYFGWKCVVCEQTLPTVAMKNTSNKFQYLKHPFFDKEVSYYSGDYFGSQNVFGYLQNSITLFIAANVSSSCNRNNATATRTRGAAISTGT